jgi:sigma-B regulation protein RsbU (phosphoserine phosphatase)
MFVTLFYAVLDIENLSFHYANAGHNPPILLNNKAAGVMILQTQGAPLGISQDIKVKTEAIKFKPGDIMVLYTDGITEALNEDGERFDIERFKQVFSSMDSVNLSAQEMIIQTQKDLALFTGNQTQFDDITIMVIKAV